MTRSAVTAIVLTGLVVGLSFQGSRGLFETTEGRYAEVAREMLDSGSWLTPTLDHEPHWTKPPLAYWAIAGGLALVGRNEWGVRLANALALPLVALAVAALGSLLWGSLEGLAAGLVYATAVFPVAAASTVSTDLLLALWEAWAVAAYWAAARDLRGKGRLWTVAFWGLLGLAFLTKGPPGLLPLLPILVYGYLARRRGWPRASLGSLGGLVLFAGIGLTWYLWAVLTTPGLLGYFLGDEVVARVATDRFGRNPEWWRPALVYGVPLLLGLGPWLAWRPVAAARQLRAEAKGWRSPEIVFLALWLGLPLVVLSLSRSRLPLYALPFFPAIVLGFVRAHSAREDLDGRPGGTLSRWALAAAALVLTVKAVSSVVSSPKDMRPLAEAVTGSAPDAVLLVDEAALFGLQFYLDVPLVRSSSAEIASSWPDVPGGGGRAPSRILVVGRRSEPSSWTVNLPPGCTDRVVPLAGSFRGAIVTCGPTAAPLASGSPDEGPRGAGTTILNLATDPLAILSFDEASTPARRMERTIAW